MRSCWFSASMFGAAGLLFLTAVSTGEAATFQVLRPPGYDDVIVTMTGEVTDGDAERFEKIATSLGGAHATVNVSGPGGLLDEALDIGVQVQEHHFSTMVSPGAECFSSCALIWLSGVGRYLSPSSIIGVHAAYTRDGDINTVSGRANAKIGAFLNMIGLPLDAITYITTAGPDDAKMITPAIARYLGIEVYEQQGSDTVSPRQEPTAYVLARQTAELAAIAVQCPVLLEVDPATVRQAMERTLGKAHAEFGGDRMAEIVSWMPAKIRADIERDGVVSWCFEAAPRLRAEGLSFGFDGPSFDCLKASTPTEHAICRDASLWGPDRAMSSLYSYRRKQANPEMKARLRDSQRAWISRRGECGADTTCMTEVYRQRLAELGVE